MKYVRICSIQVTQQSSAFQRTSESMMSLEKKPSIQHESSLMGFKTVKFTGAGFKLYSLAHDLEAAPCGVVASRYI